ncbi:hypothetical protein Dvina_39945 [Dactylosporangium vinaceum]|uniref:Secreted protein n=1 Tax=Dactylosporangium vinaceum TaxID=53362 RepID=A0ABV5M8M8_9ACTN|nr:hypothetical protein [Dactylosporangium vinaceum]UAB94276.1 hypothetical protein Dvina_39945 [Dactylosporangium vinaceum]
MNFSELAPLVTTAFAGGGLWLAVRGLWLAVREWVREHEKTKREKIREDGRTQRILLRMFADMPVEPPGAGELGDTWRESPPPPIDRAYAAGREVSTPGAARPAARSDRNGRQRL